MTVTLTLEKHTWEILGPLAGADSATFGRVLEVSDERGREAVAKLVPKRPGAARELLFSELPGVAQNVIPVLDTGDHEDHLVLVMPRAQTSLERRLQEGLLDLEEVLKVLTDIAEALASLDGVIVHRDLKPANVLLYEERWCLADFGIARYEDASTAPDTRKYCWSPQYAAPEQWLHQTATSRTDIYSFGVLAHRLVSGELPFTGSTEELRDAHLRAVPKPEGPPRLRSIIEECLYKEPDARPPAANVLARLGQVATHQTGPGLSALARLTESVRAQRATAFAEQRASQEGTRRREGLLATAIQSYGTLVDPLFDELEDGLGTAGDLVRRPTDDVAFEAKIAGARLVVSAPVPAGQWSGPFEVIAAASLIVYRQQASPLNGWIGRGHSLWYCDARTEGHFAWFELAFMANPYAAGFDPVEPYSLAPASAGIAFSNVMGTVQLAWPVSQIDRDDLSEFNQRWIEWLASAGEGSLAKPSTMPERDPGGSWRRRGAS